MKKFKSKRVRVITMLAILVFAAVGYFTVFGLGNICGIGFGDITLLCPLGSVMAMLSERTLIPLAVISVVVVLAACLILGKVFCSWVCPVHFMQRKKRVEPTVEDAGKGSPHVARPRSLAAGGIKIDSRHGVLAGALVSTLIFGFPVFCLICPVGLTFATVLLIMRLFAFGETTWTIIAFPVIIAIEVILLPRWCKRFCPLGALLSLFSAGNRTFRPTVDETKCVKRTKGTLCNLCEKSCPEGINLHDVSAGETTLNDCSKCLDCKDACPVGAISFPFLAGKKDASESEEPCRRSTE